MPAPQRITKSSFNVTTISVLNEQDALTYVHWSKGLKMTIQKNGTTIELNDDEIEQLVRSLPRTIGGRYS